MPTAPAAASPNVAAAPANVPTVSTTAATASSPAPSAESFEEEQLVIDDIGINSAQVSAPAGAAPTTIAAPSPAATTAAPQSAPPAAMAAPTPAQFAHLYAIRERLSPDERAYAEGVIARMSPVTLAQWLCGLSAMSIDDATTAIRTTMAQLRAETPTQ
jgi:hypothetical protein